MWDQNNFCFIFLRHMSSSVVSVRTDCWRCFDKHFICVILKNVTCCILWLLQIAFFIDIQLWISTACYDSLSRTKEFTLLTYHMWLLVSLLQMTSISILRIVLLIRYCWCKLVHCVFFTVIFSFFVFFFISSVFIFYYVCIYCMFCIVGYLHCLCGE